jgi:hypothetical protein
MPKPHMLETRTITLLELLGNGRQYVIPPYQRDYSWSDENWDDLWSDILALREDPSASHYMGAMVAESLSDRRSCIIDGQQRLATLSILALVIIGELQTLAEAGEDTEANRERARSLRSKFIGEKDPASLVEFSKLSLNETDNDFYQEYLVQLRTPRNPRRLPRSNQLLWRCYEYFQNQLRQLPAAQRSGQTLAELLMDTIARQLLFILITVDNELNAYTVFETLNARGLELSATDLLKNYLFSRVQTREDLDSLQRRWKQMIETVRQEAFPEFLRYHFLCEQTPVRSSRLYKIVRDRVATPQQVFDLMDALEGRAELFAALGDELHDYWRQRPECRPLIRERVLLQGQQSMPLLFAAYEQFPERDFERVLKLVNVFTFRYSTVSRLNTNELEPLFHKAAHGILQQTIRNPSQVMDCLRPHYISDDTFRQNFEELQVQTSGPRKRLARYILCRLEHDASGREIDYLNDAVTIEHILPENPIEAWQDSIPESEWGQQVYRIGNLTLLEATRNRRNGNRSYADKLPEYAASAYVLTNRLDQVAPEEWTVTAIDRRQRQLAGRAVHLWRSDFE